MRFSPKFKYNGRIKIIFLWSSLFLAKWRWTIFLEMKFQNQRSEDGNSRWKEGRIPFARFDRRKVSFRDTAILSTRKSIRKATKTLNEIEKWTKDNKIKINTTKCVHSHSTKCQFQKLNSTTKNYLKHFLVKFSSACI